MNNFGFIKVASAIPVVEIASPAKNAERIIELIIQAEKQNVEVVSFPELCITGYTCADLFSSSALIQKAEEGLGKIVKATENLKVTSIVGLPVAVGNRLYNCAVVVSSGRIAAVVPKTFRPGYGEFYETRWFASAADSDVSEITLCGQSVPFGNDILVCLGDVTFGIEICEDLWTVVPPSSLQALAGAQIIFNLSASNAIAGKHEYRRHLVTGQSARTISAIVYSSAGFGESSTDLLFEGCGIIAENGTILAEGERFSSKEQLVVSEIDIERLLHDRRKNTSFMGSASDFGIEKTYREVTLPRNIVPFELTRKVDSMPFVPKGSSLDERCEEIFAIQSEALAVRLANTGIKSAVVGISGGLDSTLALIVTVEAFDRLGIDRKNILGVTMPGFGTTKRTKGNAVSMMESLGVSIKTISIAKACKQHFADIDHNPEITDVTYENTQARERTQILMDLAHKCGGLVVGTGDMSELALGWATYNGDHMSMYGVNAGVPKTLVKHLVGWFADNKADAKTRKTLWDIIATPISPERLPADDKGNITQKTEDLVGPYELHDFFLYYFLRFGFSPEKIQYLAEKAFSGSYDKAVIEKWLKTFVRRFFNQQFKRSCMPDGPKVGSVNLSPRGDWRMPSDASWKEWI